MSIINQEDTISAIATPVGLGGIGIIRLSGKNAIEIADTIFFSKKGKKIKDMPSYTALYGEIKENENSATIDEVLILLMRSPYSYTCEDVVEIHCHAGAVPLKEILLLTLKNGARLAEPGEFTKRAFLNGRIDLTQAEAVIDVISAKTASSLKAATNNLSGQLRDKVNITRQNILEIIAHLEAVIDFPEEDIEDVSAAAALEKINIEKENISNILSTAKTGKILREGLKTAIIGKPNVGKSSLLNSLIGEDKAIVTDIAGTTRDVIEEYLNIEGIPLRIMDTAGIRKTTDKVEKIGIDLAKKTSEEADLRLLILDSSMPLEDLDIELIKDFKNENTIVLLNKSDLEQKIDLDTLEKLLDSQSILQISIKTNSGLDELKKEIIELVYENGENNAPEANFVSNARQINLLEETITHLDDAAIAANSQMPIDCIVVDIKLAWETLGKITGDSLEEDIIDQIFSQFCIGK
ncbi:tRNA uridine-5-carboxymethylaminomethyl(34) synthesis GTPase MnmE [Selenomonadales bacterium OttesenSCG-928-I06]|nr:tRNA uridine-5-carboxymethylaminomethyl(34) synthesis GTPase MnmE [Selenomonadales bacterium OttesenSCG-928-I06]